MKIRTRKKSKACKIKIVSYPVWVWCGMPHAQLWPVPGPFTKKEIRRVHRMARAAGRAARRKKEDMLKSIYIKEQP